MYREFHALSLRREVFSHKNQYWGIVAKLLFFSVVLDPW